MLASLELISTRIAQYAPLGRLSGGLSRRFGLRVGFVWDDMGTVFFLFTRRL